MNKDETRLHIIGTAAALFARNGFANTSMNDIVRETGLSKGGIYWHFRSREEIVEAIFAQYFQAQIALLAAFSQEKGPVNVRIRTLIRRVGEDLGEPGPAFPEPLEFYAQALRDENLLNLLKTYFDAYAMHLADLIQQGMASGEFAAGNAQQAAIVLISALEGIILLHTLTASQDALDSQLMAAVELFLSGLKNPVGDATT
jgi:AcrR family transcriptional regulator